MLRNHFGRSLKNKRLVACSHRSIRCGMFFKRSFVNRDMVVQKQYSNYILQGLPPGEFASVASELNEVELSKDAVLFERDAIATNIYFPIDSVISFLGDTGDGGSIEVWAVGS